MKPADIRSVLSHVCTKAPRQAADGLLSYLAEAHSARTAAIFVPGDEALTLFSSIGFEQDALDWTHATWRKAQRQLASGLEIQDGDHALVPVKREQELAALLYLRTAHVKINAVLEIVNELAAAVTLARGSAVQKPIDEYLDRTPRDEVERRQLVVLLTRYHWNKAFVAEEMGVSRQTIYRQMERLSIPLERPAK